jgi:hypothetical protein
VHSEYIITKREVLEMRRFLILLILMIFSVPAYSATIYKWVDKEGALNFTDDLDKVPPSYRDRVEVETRKDVQEQKAPLPPQAITPSGKGDEIITDTYGQDESWWRDKVRPWKEKLKEATEKYEEAKRNYEKKSEELTHTNFAGRSRSQSKWDVMELNRLREEKEKYEAQVSEANAMLEKLSKEAKEAKADPSWLE